MLPTPVFLGFPCGSAGKESTCIVGDPGLIPGLGRSPGVRKGYLHQYSGLANSMDSIVHGVTNSWEQLRDFHFRREISLVQSLNRVQLFATPRTAAHQASLSITNSRSLLQLLSIDSVMPSNHLILCCPRLLLQSSQHQGLSK